MQKSASSSVEHALFIGVVLHFGSKLMKTSILIAGT